MAAAERIGRGDLGRILRLTLLAPDIVEKILEGKQLPEFGPPTLMEPFPACWEEQGSAGAAPYAGTRCGWPAITADTPSAAAGLLLTWRAKSSNPLTSTLPPRSPADGQDAFAAMERGYPAGSVDMALPHWKDATGEDA